MDSGMGFTYDLPTISREGFNKFAAKLGGATAESISELAMYHALKATEHRYQSQQDRASAILKRLQETKR